MDDVAGTDHAQFDVVRVTEFTLRDEITEDVFPSEDPVTSVEHTKNEMRRWVVGGVGGLIALAMILSFALVMLRPSLAEFAMQFLQLAVGGLAGLAGSVIGFLFGRECCN